MFPPCVVAEFLTEQVQDLWVEVVVHTGYRYMRLKLVMTRPAENKDFPAVVPTVVPFGVDMMTGQDTYKVATRARPFMLRHLLPPLGSGAYNAPCGAFPHR